MIRSARVAVLELWTGEERLSLRMFMCRSQLARQVSRRYFLTVPPWSTTEDVKLADTISNRKKPCRDPGGGRRMTLRGLGQIFGS